MDCPWQSVERACEDVKKTSKVDSVRIAMFTLKDSLLRLILEALRSFCFIYTVSTNARLFFINSDTNTNCRMDASMGLARRDVTICSSTAFFFIVRTGISCLVTSGRLKSCLTSINHYKISPNRWLVRRFLLFFQWCGGTYIHLMTASKCNTRTVSVYIQQTLGKYLVL